MQEEGSSRPSEPKLINIIQLHKIQDSRRWYAPADKQRQSFFF